MGDTNTSSAAGGTAGRRWSPNRHPRGANRLGAPPTSNANPPRSSSMASLPTALTVTSYNPAATGSADETASAEAGQGRSRSGERRGAVPLARVDTTNATPHPLTSHGTEPWSPTAPESEGASGVRLRAGRQQPVVRSPSSLVLGSPVAISLVSQELSVYRRT